MASERTIKVGWIFVMWFLMGSTMAAVCSVLSDGIIPRWEAIVYAYTATAVLPLVVGTCVWIVTEKLGW